MFYEAKLLADLQKRIATIADENYFRSGVIISAKEATLVIRVLKRQIKTERKKKATPKAA